MYSEIVTWVVCDRHLFVSLQCAVKQDSNIGSAGRGAIVTVNLGQAAIVKPDVKQMLPFKPSSLSGTLIVHTRSRTGAPTLCTQCVVWLLTTIIIIGSVHMTITV